MSAENAPLLSEEVGIPIPSFALAKSTDGGRKFPQAIGHRGYKAAHPENSMGAFKGAVEVGAHGIETDIHISKDGVVVLSHDPDLKRCFGRDKKVIDCDWEYLSTLRSIQEPHEPMPRLQDLLEYLVQPEQEHVWVLLDIKVPWPKFLNKNRAQEWKELDEIADKTMRLIAETISSVKPSRPWNERIVLGCWAATCVPLATKYLPGFPITHISFSIDYSRSLLKVPNMSFNIVQMILGPRGSSFLRDAKAAKRAVFLWTVNDEENMLWSIRKGVDGVITDHPKKYLEVCKNYDELEKKPVEKRTWTQLWTLIKFSILAVVFGLVFRIRYGFGVDMRKLKKNA